MEQIEYITIWSGDRGVYLSALKDCEPYEVREPEIVDETRGKPLTETGLGCRENMVVAIREALRDSPKTTYQIREAVGCAPDDLKRAMRYMFRKKIIQSENGPGRQGRVWGLGR